MHKHKNENRSKIYMDMGKENTKKLLTVNFGAFIAEILGKTK